MAKIYIYNPPTGSPIKNWYDGSSRWSLDVDEAKSFPESVANNLASTYGFLEVINESEVDSLVARLEEKKVSKLKATPDGEIVPKEEEEVAKEEVELEEKKKTTKKLVARVKKAEVAKPEKPGYDELSRGDLISECHKRKVEIKGLGKSYISKKQIIMLLENDDASK